MTTRTAEDTTETLAARLDRVTSPTERRVAEYFVRAGAKAAAMSAQEIAAAVGTSDATVVRTARTLGYDTLRELRRALADDDDDTDLPSRLEATIGSLGTGDNVLGTTINGQLAALGDLVRRITPEAFNDAVELLTSTPQTWWCGTGPSAYLAGYAAFLSRRLGRPAGEFVHSGASHADELLALRPEHVVVVLAYGRIHPYVNVLLRRVRDVNARSILITDTLGQKLSAPADVRLNAGRGTPGLFASHAPTIVLLEALVLATAAADPDVSEAALADLNRLRSELAGRRFDVDPT
jgi:DNA-binding MurR/RpiR family transcriptional regulator